MRVESGRVVRDALWDSRLWVACALGVWLGALGCGAALWRLSVDRPGFVAALVCGEVGHDGEGNQGGEAKQGASSVLDGSLRSAALLHSKQHKETGDSAKQSGNCHREEYPCRVLNDGGELHVRFLVKAREHSAKGVM